MTLYAWKEGGGGERLKMNSGSKDLTIYILEKDVFILPHAWAKEKNSESPSGIFILLVQHALFCVCSGLLIESYLF